MQQPNPTVDWMTDDWPHPKTNTTSQKTSEATSAKNIDNLFQKEYNIIQIVRVQGLTLVSSGLYYTIFLPLKKQDDWYKNGVNGKNVINGKSNKMLLQPNLTSI